MILAMAAVSFTSSFFSLAAMASPNTGLAVAARFDLLHVALVLAERVAGLDAVEPAERDRVAGLGLAALHRLLPHDREDAGDALLVGAAIDGSAVGEIAGQHAGERQLAAMRGVEGLDHEGARQRLVDAEPLRRGSRRTALRGAAP